MDEWSQQCWLCADAGASTVAWRTCTSAELLQMPVKSLSSQKPAHSSVVVVRRGLVRQERESQVMGS